MFDILVEKFDPVGLTTIDKSIVQLDESDRDDENSFSKSLNFSQFSGIYIFSAFTDSNKIPIHCKSLSCIIAVRDPSTGYIDAPMLYDLEIAESQTWVTLSFDYVVPD